MSHGKNACVADSYAIIETTLVSGYLVYEPNIYATFTMYYYITYILFRTSGHVVSIIEITHHAKDKVIF